MNIPFQMTAIDPGEPLVTDGPVVEFGDSILATAGGMALAIIGIFIIIHVLYKFTQLYLISDTFVSVTKQLIKLVVGFVCTGVGLWLTLNSSNTPQPVIKVINTIMDVSIIVMPYAIAAFAIIFIVSLAIHIYEFAHEKHCRYQRKIMIENATTLTVNNFNVDYDDNNNEIEISIGGIRIDKLDLKDERVHYGSDKELQYKCLKNQEYILISVTLDYNQKSKINDIKQHHWWRWCIDRVFCTEFTCPKCGDEYDMRAYLQKEDLFHTKFRYMLTPSFSDEDFMYWMAKMDKMGCIAYRQDPNTPDDTFNLIVVIDGEDVHNPAQRCRRDGLTCESCGTTILEKGLVRYERKQTDTHNTISQQ